MSESALPAAPLDDLDRGMISVLRAEPRATHRFIAGRLAVTEATVSSRIRRLQEANLLCATIAFDWVACGYRLAAYVWIHTVGQELADVAAELARIPRVMNVLSVLGHDADLFVNVLASDRDDLLSVMDAINAVDGVVAAETQEVLKNVAHGADVATLPIRDEPVPELPDPVITLDDLDRALCAELAVDARRSNREVARALGTSERTIRNRLSRLEESGLLHICTVLDPRAIPDLAVRGFVGVRSAGRSVEVAEQLAALPEVRGVTVTTGSLNIQLVVGAQSVDSLHALVRDQIRPVEGVRSTHTVIIGGQSYASSRLRRFL
jgi:Lrp/AsnC family transcriptional regulator for asnA, asnC and gidA